jgi:hypothetical protein
VRRRCWIDRRAWSLLSIVSASLCVLALSGSTSAASNLGMSRFFPGLFYPNAPSQTGAVLVPVAPGNGFAGADIALGASGGVVVGTVSGPEGPVAGLLIEAFRGSITVAGRTDGDGNFSLEGVPAGSAALRFSSDHPLSRDDAHAAVYLGGSRDLGSSLRLEILDSAIEEIGTVDLELGVVLGGRIHSVEGDPLEEAIVRIEEVGGAMWTTRTDQNGEYRQGGLHGGSYRIRATPPAGGYLSEFFGGARTEPEAELVAVSAPAQRVDLHIELDRGGEIRGQIRAEGSNAPYPDFIVEARESDSGETYSAETDIFGAYAIEGLPAGSYLIFVPRLNRYFPGVVRVEDARAIEVAEGAVSGRVDMTGFDLGTCQLGPGARGRIEGNLDADLSITSEILVTAYSESDTVESAFDQFGPYQLDCVPRGSYRVRFLPRGGYRTQWHEEASNEQGALLVSVNADTIRAVDYRAEKSGWITGRVTEGAGGAGIEGVRVRARSNVGTTSATARTGSDGTYRIDALADGSGLPAGLYWVNAESTLVADPDVTPVRQPTISAHASESRVEISATLDSELAWSYRIWRHRIGTGGTAKGPIEESLHPAGGGPLDVIDHPEPGVYRYELEASPVDSAPPVFRAWSNDVEFLLSPGARIFAYPDPWNGIGAIRLRRSGAMAEMSISIVDVAGRRIATVPWPFGSETSWDATDASGREVPSGVYFLGLRNEVGRLLDVTTIVIER